METTKQTKIIKIIITVLFKKVNFDFLMNLVRKDITPIYKIQLIKNKYTLDYSTEISYILYISNN